MATKLTHSDIRPIDACQFYAGLIWRHALNGKSKQQLLHSSFYQDYLKIPLHKDMGIVRGSHENKKGEEGGSCGKV